MTSDLARRRLLALLAAMPMTAVAGPAAADARRGGRCEVDHGPRIPRGYAGVDPRTARRVPLWQPMATSNPVFEGDPPFDWRIWTTVAESGYLLEQITSLGTHTGTHVSAPVHFHPSGRYLDELDERWTLMPLVVLDLRRRIRRQSPDFRVGVDDLRDFERRHDRIPQGGCVLLLTGASAFYRQEQRPGPGNDYFDPVPGLSATAVDWLFERRGVVAIGSDSFGPDATSDVDFTATSTALRDGGITVENVGTGLARMRPHGDWVGINGARPHFSGFQVGLTGYTTRSD